MTRFVVDASVAIKWYVSEVHSAEANRYFEPSVVRHAPDLLLSEIANILWKKTNRGELTSSEAIRIVNAVRGSDITFHPLRDLVAPALTIALTTGRSAYDSIYLALSDSLGIEMVTADGKLLRGLQGGPYAHLVRWVETAP